MAKAILTIGYTSYVLDIKDAVGVVEILSGAEMYESKYRSTSPNTHHIYANENPELGTIKLISDELYRLAKLAGKPDKD